MCVWIVLKANKQNAQRKEPRKALNFLKSYTLIEKYFITFIDDFYRYEHVYLLHEKSQSVNVLEVYINEVERQLDRRVKIVRSDKGDDYYGIYDESGQHLGPFAKFLEKCGICAQYIMSGTPQQNGVSEKLNLNEYG